MAWKAVLFETVVKKHASKMRWCTPWKAVPFETVVKNAVGHTLEDSPVPNSRQQSGGAHFGRLARAKQSSKMRWCTPWKARPCETVVKNAVAHTLEGSPV